MNWKDRAKQRGIVESPPEVPKKPKEGLQAKPVSAKRETKATEEE